VPDRGRLALEGHDRQAALLARDRHAVRARLCADIGEFARFAHPDQLACYLGLVPSEHTSGEIIAVAIARELAGFCWEVVMLTT
jgi:transposase